MLNTILKNPRDRTKVSIIFGNITEEDILLKEQLDAVIRLYGHRVKAG